MSLPLRELLQAAVAAAREAGALIRDHAGRDVAAEFKDAGDGAASQVVTEVDRLAQDVILKHLQPSIARYDLGLLAEESCDDGSRFSKEAFWCVDPLDGTLAFVEGKAGSAVSIGLVARSGDPLLGVVFDVATGDLFEAVKDGGVEKNGRDPVLPAPPHGRVSPEDPEGGSLAAARIGVWGDRSFQGPEYDALMLELEAIAGRRGLRLDKRICGGDEAARPGAVMNALHVVASPPSVYIKFPKPREGGGSLWDYAATACIAREAGVFVSDAYGEALDLNRGDSTFMNHRGVLFASPGWLVEDVRALLALRRGDGGGVISIP